MTATCLNYRQYGTGEGDVFVFLHGFMGDLRSLDPVIVPWAENHRCLAFDLPGHGGSLFSRSERLKALRTMDDVAALLLQDLGVLGVERFSLYGYSLGGRLAQNVAVLAPGRIDWLVLESASFGIADVQKRQERYDRDQALLAGVRTPDDFRAFLEAWHDLPLFRTLEETVLRQRLIEEKLGNDLSELRQALKILSVGGHPFFAERLAGLGLPILYLSGEGDAAYAEAGRAMQKHLPGLSLVAVPGASHDIHCQFPDRIVRALEEVTAARGAAGRSRRKEGANHGSR